MKNIAILYDVENLVGGYNLKYLSEISLKNILKKLEEIGLSDIAIQKAYADWSNYKLSSLKWDIAELGIEPVQMYGFSKGNMKNAADIQLVIDAMEILYKKDFIDTFVIVSGDGGFSSLVKKISEYGKRVIGCAYKQTANNIFTKICDDFIYIDNTLTKDQLEILNKLSLDENKKKQLIENPILKNVLPKIESISDYDLDLVESKIQTLMQEFSNNMEAKRILQHEGMNISVFKSSLNYLFDDFDFRKFGFARLSDFTRYTLRNTGFQLVLKEPSDYRITFNDVTIPGFDKIEHIQTRPKIHSKDNYIQYLSSKQPIIHIPDNICNFHKITDFLIENRDEFRDKYYPDIISDLTFLNVEEKEIAKILSLLINTKNFIGDNSSVILKEQSFYFSPLNKEELISNIEESIKNKILTSIDGTIDEDELSIIINKFKKTC